MVRTRIAPSPTGFLQLGNLQTALFNYAFAKKYNGKWIVRLEDTDQKRLVEGAKEEIFRMLRAYGLEYDEGPDIGGPFEPYVQSERLEIYQEKAKRLVEEGKAYYCFCSKERLEKMREEQDANKQKPGYDRHCRNINIEESKAKVSSGEEYTVRLKVPNDRIIEQKSMFGKPFSFNSNDLDDQVLLKSDGFPTYYLAVVVDDVEMEITHIMKGAEWQSSDPKLLLIFEALGYTPPIFGYLPLLLDPTGGKLSKRKGNVFIRTYLEEGFLPEAVINYLMFMGWNPGDDREIFTLEQFINEFDEKKINPSNAVFDRVKLLWMNGIWLRSLTDEEYLSKFKGWTEGYGKEYASTKSFYKTILETEDKKLSEVIALEKERAKTWKELFDSLDIFFVENLEVDRSDPKYNKLNQADFVDSLQSMLKDFEEYDSDSSNWSHEAWEKTVRTVADEKRWKHGEMFMLLRFALVGKSVSPELFSTMKVLGKEKVMSRINNFLVKIN